MSALLFWLLAVVKGSILCRSFLNDFLLAFKLTFEQLSC